MNVLDDFLKTNNISPQEWEDISRNVAKGITEGFPFKCHPVNVLDFSDSNLSIKHLKCK